METYEKINLADYFQAAASSIAPAPYSTNSSG